MPAAKPKVRKPCTNCKTIIERPPSQFIGKLAFCSMECRNIYNKIRYKGSNNPFWKGGKRVVGKGYIQVRMPDHPRARKNGYVLEHILVVEKMLERSLKPGECVHHVNGNPADNRPENLKVYRSNGEHHKKANHHKLKQPPCLCGRPAKGHGLCTRHLAQMRRTGKTWDFENEFYKAKLGEKGNAVRGKKREPCPCGQPSRCRGLCGKHYQRLMKYGELPEFGINLQS